MTENSTKSNSALVNIVDEALRDLQGTYSLDKRSRRILERMFWGIFLLGAVVVIISFLKESQEIIKLSLLTALMFLASMSVTRGIRNYKEVRISAQGVFFLPNGPNIDRSKIKDVSISQDRSSAKAIRLKVRDHRVIYLIGTVHWLFDTVTFNID